MWWADTPSQGSRWGHRREVCLWPIQGLWGLQEGAWGRGPRQGLTEAAVAHHSHPPRDPVQGHVLESGGLWSGSELCQLLAARPPTHEAWAAADLWTFDP